MDSYRNKLKALKTKDGNGSSKPKMSESDKMIAQEYMSASPERKNEMRKERIKMLEEKRKKMKSSLNRKTWGAKGY